VETLSTVHASKEYIALIKRFPLRPIRDEEMLDLASDLFSELVLKAERRTPDESDYLSILGKLIREYEDAHKAMPPRMTPQRALESLMEDNRLSQSELARQLEASQSVISEFLSGRRGLSKALVLKLAEHFKVSPELFLSSQPKH
jgi:HTH-type transcriptional regulator/antitoxin HigA